MIYSGVDRPGRKASCLYKNAAFLHKVLKNLFKFNSKSWLAMVLYSLLCVYCICLLSFIDNFTKYQNFLTKKKHPRGLRDKTLSYYIKILSNVLVIEHKLKYY